jgi:hypothetical protein
MTWMFCLDFSFKLVRIANLVPSDGAEFPVNYSNIQEAVEKKEEDNEFRILESIS